MGFTKVSMMYVVALFTAIYFEIISPIVRRLVENTIQTRCYPNLVSPIRSCLFKRLWLTDNYSRVIYMEYLAVDSTYTLYFRQMLFNPALLLLWSPLLKPNLSDSPCRCRCWPNCPSALAQVYSLRLLRGTRTILSHACDEACQVGSSNLQIWEQRVSGKASCAGTKASLGTRGSSQRTR